MAKKRKLEQLDQQISELQSSLFDLYKQRQVLFTGDNDYPAALRAATSQTTASADNQYERLKAEWAAKEVTIPARTKLIKKIKSGLVVIEQLAQELGVSPEVLKLVLIPPTKVYGDKDLLHDRLMQGHIRYADQFDSAQPRHRQTDWKLLAVYDGLEGLDFGSAAEILADKTYVINGLDSRALGPREYAIYALTHSGRRDSNWLWLLKDAADQAWSVRLISGAYHYTLDDLQGIGQGELFRPSVEIV
jgi:hypothetical protein